MLAELASEILFLRTYLSFLILILDGNVILVSSTEYIPRSWGTHLPVEQRSSSIQTSGSLNICMPSRFKTVMWIISVLLTDANILQEFLIYLVWLHVLSLGIFIRLTCGYTDLNIVVDSVGQCQG